MADVMEQLAAALADRYRIESRLGAGGMATVYLAEDLKHRRQVAVKVLRPELAAALGRERFLREIEVVAQLNHPRIMALHDSGEADGYLYYVMPLAEGESLRDRIDRNPQLPLDEAVRITEQVASALDYAHRRGLIHRDIKPENILLHDGEAIVTDFGIALAVSEAGGTRLTGTGLSIGTPHYMSPEQAMGERELDARSDVYALGSVLYEMLAGQPPFTGETMQSLVAQRITEDAPSVSTVREHVPTPVIEAVARALARGPADRFESAAEFASALRDEDPTATGTAEASSSWRHPVRAAAAFGAASLVVLAVVYGLMLQLGLPDWVLRAAIVLLIIGLPIVAATAMTEWQRAGQNDREQHRWLNWRRALQGGSLAFSALAVSTAGLLGLGALGIGPAGTLITRGVLDARDPILLAGVVNRTTDTTLGATVTELLRIDLAQSRVVRLLDGSTIDAARERMLVDPEAPLDETLARRIAQREGVKAVLAADVSPLGAGFVLAARLLSPDGGVLDAVRTTARDATELIAAVDDLSNGVRERIGESLRDVRASPRLERVTTSSVPALRKYTEAMTTAAIASGADLQLLEDAVALDTTFAMAYRRLGIVLNRRGRADDSQAAVRRAFELRDRLPESERYTVMGLFYSNLEYDSAGVENAYRSALAIDPENVPALVNLGFHQAFTRNWAVRESLLMRAIEVVDANQPHPSHFIVYLNTLNARLLQGRFDEADSTIRQFAAGQGEGPINWWFQLAIARGEYDRAEALFQGQTARGVGFADPSADQEALGDLLWLRGRLREAEGVFREEMSRRTGASGYLSILFHLALMEADHGVGSAALETLDGYAFDSLPAADRFYLERAELYAGLGRLEEARRLVAEYEAPREESYLRQPTRRGQASRVAGEIALAEGRFDDAAEAFTVAHRLAGQCSRCGLHRLGQALLLGGRPDSALTVFEYLVAQPVAFVADDDARWLAPTLRQLGELYEARGQPERAVEYYHQFVELWEKADRELQPLVAEARRRIANLVGEPRP